MDPYASGEVSWARALLRRGWDLSRKAAIAGVAATAAPVIVPPIIILSIAGVALSVPFAACLASVAATDRLMAALLPPQPCGYTYDDEESSEQEELVDDQEAAAPVLNCSSGRSRTEEEGDSAEGEFAVQKSGRDLFVPKIWVSDTAMEVDNEYITMEAPSPGMGIDSSLPQVPEEDNMVRLVPMEQDPPVPAKESVPELSVSDNENKTESRITAENKSMLSPCLQTTESSDVARYVKGDASVRKSDVSDCRDKTEHNKTTVVDVDAVSVSESQRPDDQTLPTKLEDEIPQREEMRDTYPVTGEGVHVQLDGVPAADAKPESELLQSRHRVAPELQAMTESACVLSLKGIVKHADSITAEGVEHHGVEDVPSMVTVDDDKDQISVTAISDGITGVRSKPYADHPNQTTCAADKDHDKEKVTEDKSLKTEESKTMDNKVPIADMAAQDSKSLLPDDQSTGEDQATMEMVLEEVTNSIDPVTREVVEVEVDIITSESESLPLSDIVAHELQMMNRAVTVDDKTEDTVKGIGDTEVVDVEHQGASSFVSVTSALTMDDGKDRMSSRRPPYVSAISDDMTTIESKPVVEHHHQTTGVEYKAKDSEFETEVLAEDKDMYTEEQLREQLNTLRTITGYRAVTSLTLEGDLAGLYIFVGVEPPHSSGGASNLTELNSNLRFLKSIIGVE